MKPIDAQVLDRTIEVALTHSKLHKYEGMISDFHQPEKSFHAFTLDSVRAAILLVFDSKFFTYRCRRRSSPGVRARSRHIEQFFTRQLASYCDKICYYTKI